MEKLVQLLLFVLSQLLLLLASLQARMIYFMRTVPREALSTLMRRVDAAVRRGAAAVLDFPPGVGEYIANREGLDKALLGRQRTIPLRHGGLGGCECRQTKSRTLRPWLALTKQSAT